MRFPDVDQYISDFEDLVRQAGYTIGNEETIGFFLNGLSPSILEEVIRDPFPQNYNQYKAKVVNITKGKQMIELIRARQEIPNPRGFNNMFGQNQNQFRPRTWGGRPQQNQQRPQQQQQQQQRPQYNSTNAPHPTYNNVQVPMDLSRTRTPYNWCQYWGNNTYTNMVNMQEAYGNATNTQEQTYQCQHPKGPCFNCRKMGHFAKDCHSNPSSNINYMDTEDEDMRNIPQLNITPRANIGHIKAQIDTLSEADNNALINAMGSSQDFTHA
jgi:hypothetical protein